MDKKTLEAFKALWLKDVAPPTKCEGCGKILPTHADATNMMIVIGVGVPGHPGLPSFQCPQTEHWTCSPECWEKVAIQCIREHMKPLLQAGVERVRGSGK